MKFKGNGILGQHLAVAGIKGLSEDGKGDDVAFLYLQLMSQILSVYDGIDRTFDVGCFYHESNYRGKRSIVLYNVNIFALVVKPLL